MEYCEGRRVPMGAGVKVGDCVEENERVDKPFKSLVGSLLYPSQWCRPDLSYAVGALSQVMAGPSQKHWDIGMDILKYLKGAKDMELTYQGNGNIEITAYADSDFANDATNGKSIYGYVVFVGGNAVSWKSKKASTTATSTTIAELDAVYHCATECKWIGEFLKTLGVKEKADFKIYSDNQSAVKVLLGEKYLDWTKHETVKIEYLRDLIRSGIMSVEWIGTESMVADALTKGVGRNKFTQFTQCMGLYEEGNPGFRGSVEVNKDYHKSGG